MEKTIEQKRILLEKKIERIFLEEQFEESEDSFFMSYEQWLRIRKLRKYEEDKKIPQKDRPTIKTFSFCKTEIYAPSNIDEDKYIKRIQEEYEELKKYQTFDLLKDYRSRHRHTYYYYCNFYNSCESYEIHFEGKNYLEISFKCVLDEREHIERRKDKVKIKNVGKKDKKHGRKNPTNRK